VKEARGIKTIAQVFRDIIQRAKRQDVVGRDALPSSLRYAETSRRVP
jgi:hypothetical protein